MKFTRNNIWDGRRRLMYTGCLSLRDTDNIQFHWKNARPQCISCITSLKWNLSKLHAIESDLMSFNYRVFFSHHSLLWLIPKSEGFMGTRGCVSLKVVHEDDQASKMWFVIETDNKYRAPFWNVSKLLILVCFWLALLHWPTYRAIT